METIEECENNLLEMYSEKRKIELLLSAIGSSSADMLWAKDTEGRYVWANSKIISGLLFSKNLLNTIGKTDVELAEEHRGKVGAASHTVGAVCADSDSIVLKNEKPMKFVEPFVVDGEVLVLEVHKNVMRDATGEVIGTVGTGRDITYEFNKLHALAQEEDMPQKYRDCICDLIHRNYLGEKDGRPDGTD